jgi:hypothetical protein
MAGISPDASWLSGGLSPAALYAQGGQQRLVQVRAALVAHTPQHVRHNVG